MPIQVYRDVIVSLRGAILGGLLACPCLLAQVSGQEDSAVSHRDFTSLSLEDLANVKVFSASRHAESLEDAPSSVTIITRGQIQENGWRTLGDALRSVRSFYVSYDRNYTYVGVRGFLRQGDYNSRILLQIDGHRINDNVYQQAPAGTEFPLDVDLIDRIEIVRGPSSSLYGTNAFFAVVNVITRRADQSWNGEVSGDVASFLSRNGRASIGYKSDRISTFLSGSMYRSAGPADLYLPAFDAPSTNYGHALNADGDRSDQIFGSLEHGNLRIQGLYGKRTKIVPTASFGTNFNDPGTKTTDERSYLDVSYHRQLSSATSYDFRVYVDQYKYEGYYAYGGTGTGRFLNYDEGDAAWSGTDALVEHDIGPNRVIAGAQYEHDFRLHQENRDIGGQTYEDESHSSWLAAMYLEVEWKPLPELAVNAGIREDWYQHFRGEFSPRVALIYTPAARTSLKYIVGRAFRAPNDFELNYSDGKTMIANPHLLPENILTNDLIFEHRPKTWLHLTGEAYYNQLRQMIDQDLDQASGMLQYENRERDRGAGLEFQADVKRQSGWSLGASYTLQSVESADSSMRLANDPLHIAKFNGAAPVGQHLVGGLELQYSSVMKSYQGSPVPSALLTNLTFSTKPIWAGWQISASCYNLLDQKWYSPGGLEQKMAEIPQDGRTFRLKITYHLPSKETRKK